jgi:mRNA interferase HigB
VFVIARSRLREFWEQAGHEDSLEPLAAWFKIAETTDWSTWADVKLTFGSASTVGNCTIFNIAGNKYRLATRIIYAKHRVYVLRVMSHREYDDQKKWQSDCGCHEPPPTPAPAKTVKRKK